MSSSPEQELEVFIAKYSPDIASLAVKRSRKLRLRLPGAYELAYDNYYPLAIGFSPTERTSNAFSFQNCRQQA